MLRRHSWTFFSVFLAAIFMLPSVAEASHFRYGNITWTRAPGTRDVTFTVTTSWRVSPFTRLNFGDGQFVNRGQSQMTAISSGPNYTTWRYQVTHTYGSDGPFDVFFESCCRIGGIVNASNAYFKVSSCVDLRNDNNGSPVSGAPVIIQMVQGGVNNIPLPVVDPEFDALTCRLGTVQEATGRTSGYSTPSAGGHSLGITSPCTLTWDTSGTSIGQLYAVHMRVDEVGNDSYIEIDFFIEIVDGTLNQPPTCAVVDEQNPFVAQPDVPIVIEVTGTDPDNDPLTVTNTGLPAGAFLVNTSGPSPLTTELHWTPSVADRGSAQAITLVFEDDGGLQATCGLAIAVPDNQPPVCDAGNDLTTAVVNVGDAVNRTLTFTDPDGDFMDYLDGDSTRPATSSAPGVTQVAGQTDVAFSWTPTGDDVGSHEVTLVVEDESGAQVDCTFMVEVVNRDPNCDPANVGKVAFGQVLSHDVTLSDPDGHDLTIGAISWFYDGNATSPPSGASLTPSSGTHASGTTMTLDWTPDVLVNPSGLYEVHVILTDPYGGEFDCVISMFVLNRRPECTSVTIDYEERRGLVYICDLTRVTWVITDPDPGDELTLVSQSGIPPSATISTSGTNPLTVVMEWTPPLSDLGRRYRPTVVISDINGGGTKCSATDRKRGLIARSHPPKCVIDVAAPYVPEPDGSYVINVGDTFSATFTGRDPDECDLLLFTGTTPAGSFTPSSGTVASPDMVATFSWTPSAAEADGSVRIAEAEFKDNSGLKGARAKCGLELRVNAPPVIECDFEQFTFIGDGADLTLNGSLTVDDEDALGDLNFEWFIDGDPACSGPGVATCDVTLSFGTHLVTLVVTDLRGASSSQTKEVIAEPAALSVFDCEKIEVKFCLGDADSDSSDDDSSADDDSSGCTSDRVKIKGEIGLPIGVDYTDIDPLSLVALDVALDGFLVADFVPVVFEVHGGNDDHWKYRDDDGTLGITKLDIDWKGARFKYEEAGIKLESELITSTETVLKFEYKMGDIGGPFNMFIEGVLIEVDAAGTVTAPAEVGITVKKTGKKVELTLPFPLIDTSEFIFTGAVASTVLVSDHYTSSLGRFKLEATRSDPLFVLGADTPDREVSLTMLMGVQMYPGGCSADADALKVHSRKWKAKK